MKFSISSKTVSKSSANLSCATGHETQDESLKAHAEMSVTAIKDGPVQNCQCVCVCARAPCDPCLAPEVQLKSSGRRVNWMCTHAETDAHKHKHTAGFLVGAAPSSQRAEARRGGGAPAREDETRRRLRLAVTQVCSPAKREKVTAVPHVLHLPRRHYELSRCSFCKTRATTSSCFHDG